MPVYPGAKWEPVGASSGNGSNGPMHSHTGIVLHVNDAMSDDLHNFIVGSWNGPNPVSCHFQVNTAGTVYQYIDTNASSWCQGNGNDDYLSIETEGLAGQPLTDAQVKALGSLLSWVHSVHGIPLQLANAPGQAGFGWHGMGAAQGWGHALCPGVRKDQRAAILALAQPAIDLGDDVNVNDQIPFGPKNPDGSQRMTSVGVAIGQINYFIEQNLPLIRDSLAAIAANTAPKAGA